MRQISIKELGKRLSIELLELPLAVTKYGKIICVMVAPDAVSQALLSTDLINKGANNKPEKLSKGTDNDKSMHNVVESTKVQLANTTKKKQKVLTPKATISKGETSWVNPLTGSALAPKK